MGRRAKRKSVAAIEKKIQQGGYKEEDDALGDLMTAGITAYGAKLLYDGLKDAPVEDIEIPKGTEWVEEGSTTAGTKWEGESFKPPPSTRERIAEKDAMVAEGGAKSLELAQSQKGDAEREEAFWKNQEKLAEGRKKKHAQYKEKARLTKENIAATSAAAKKGSAESLEFAMDQDAPVREAARESQIKQAAFAEKREGEKKLQDRGQYWKDREAEFRKQRQTSDVNKLREKTRRSIGPSETRSQIAAHKMKKRTNLSHKKRREVHKKYNAPTEGFEYKPREPYQSPYPTLRGRAANRDRLAEVQGPQQGPDQGLIQRLRSRLGF